MILSFSCCFLTVGTLVNKAGSVTMTCQLTDTSEVAHYEWVHRDFDHGGNPSVVSIHKGKNLEITQTSGDDKGEWTCRFYGKQGILGNVTHRIAVMSTFLFLITLSLHKKNRNNIM